MKTSVLLSLCLVALSAVTCFTEVEYQSHFTSFIKKYEKKYTATEFFSKFNVFKRNLDVISQHNGLNKSYTMAVNEFADMTFAEFHAKMTGFNDKKNEYIRSQNAASFQGVAAPPASVDWRQKNAVTGVKNQQQCGSCWSFSATGSTEGIHAISTGTLVSLSEQELVDCSTSYGNQGCNGGLMDQAFEFIIANGICSESSYPYTAAQGTCQQKSCTSVASLTSYKDIPQGNEADLLPAVAQQPVSIAIEADSMAFQFYSGGVFDDASCGTNLDHGVLIVGYGTDSGKDYWIVKNSWGSSWGESGYIRMVRGKNMCGLSNSASYPIA